MNPLPVGFEHAETIEVPDGKHLYSPVLHLVSRFFNRRACCCSVLSREGRCLPLPGEVHTSWGVDLSPAIIARAKRAGAAASWKDRAPFISQYAIESSNCGTKSFCLHHEAGTEERDLPTQRLFYKPGRSHRTLTPSSR